MSQIYKNYGTFETFKESQENIIYNKKNTLKKINIKKKLFDDVNYKLLISELSDEINFKNTLNK